MILSHALFLFARSLTKQKLSPELEVPEYKRLPIVDSINGMKMLVDMFVNITYSWIVSILVYNSP
jgi:hypothetical protein